MTGGKNYEGPRLGETKEVGRKKREIVGYRSMG